MAEKILCVQVDTMPQVLGVLRAMEYTGRVCRDGSTATATLKDIRSWLDRRHYGAFILWFHITSCRFAVESNVGYATKDGAVVMGYLEYMLEHVESYNDF